MRYRPLLVLGALASVSFTGACFNGDDDDTVPIDAAVADAAPGTDGGAAPGDATVDGAVGPTAEAGTPDSGKYVPPASDGGIPARCNGAISSANTPNTVGDRPPLGVADGFTLSNITKISDGPRQMVVFPNGDMLVGTNTGNVYILTNADGAPGTTASAPMLFASFGDAPAQGVAFDPTTCTIYVGTRHAIYAMPYVDAQLTGTVSAPIANLRTLGSDGGSSDHVTTSLAVVPGGHLYAAIGSDCDACTETDPTRGTIQQLNLDGSGMTTVAAHVRDAIAMTVNAQSGVLWAGGAGQDNLPVGHPYEWVDAITSHPGVPDYGWPGCEEDHVAYVTGASCANQTVPLIETPPYQTIVGAVFYPDDGLGNERAYDFGAAYRGGLFLVGHGSGPAHLNSSGFGYTPPLIMFVPMKGDAPVTAVDWSDPTAQYQPFVYGFQNTVDGTRSGEPTGAVVGPKGTLFIADDFNTDIYSLRPH